MPVLQSLAKLASRNLAEGACQALGLSGAERTAEAASHFLAQRFTDQSRRLGEALRHASARAWHVLELALAGDSFWQRCRGLLAGGEDRALRDQVRVLLGSAHLPEVARDDAFRAECLRELQGARRAGVLMHGGVDFQHLARQAGSLVRFTDPTQRLDAEWQTLGQVADELRQAGYPRLGEFVALRPPGGESLLAVAVRYFFRRAVEEDRELFQGLAFAQLDRLQHTQEEAFDRIGRVLTEQGDRLESLLDDVQATVEQTRAAVLDLKAEQERQGEQNRELYQAVLALQAKFDLARREVRASDSLSIRSDAERRLVKELVGRYRALPENRRHDLPALLNAVGQLEVATGAFDAAGQDFQRVATLVADPQAKGEAHVNAYRAALERRDWHEALRELRTAIDLDARRFAPLPVSKYEPLAILGAGGFGVAFLCRHRFLGTRVVVKAFSVDGLERGIDEVFAEARALRALNHPAIIRVQDSGFTDPAAQARPFLVMDYFESTTLEEAVLQRGPLPAGEVVALARQTAAGLRAAHTQGILHRDVKPANLLVGPGEPAASAAGFQRQVKLIDFGLALRQGLIRSLSSRRARTLVGDSIAGTLEYAAPEQMGKFPGVTPGPAADTFGLAKTCCHALFQTTQPLPRHWRSIPPGLADLLEQCLAERPDERPTDVALEIAFNRLAGPAPDAPAPPPLPRAAFAPPPELPPAPAPRPAVRPAPRRSAVALAEPPPRRHNPPPLVWVIGGVGLLAVVVVGVLAMASGRGKPTPTTPELAHTPPGPPPVVVPNNPGGTAGTPKGQQGGPPPAMSPVDSSGVNVRVMGMRVSVNLKDPATDALSRRLQAACDNPQMFQSSWSTREDGAVITVRPVKDPAAYALRLGDLGEVFVAPDRTVYLTVGPGKLPASDPAPPPSRPRPPTRPPSPPPAAPPASPPEPDQTESLDQLIAGLRTGPPAQRAEAALKLAKLPADPARRKDVAAALLLALRDRSKDKENVATLRAACRAAGVWGTPETADALMLVVARTDAIEARLDAIDALGELRYEPAIGLLFDRLLVPAPTEVDHIFDALKKIGLPAERAAVSHLDGKNPAERLAGLQILSKIATADSVPALQKFVKAERVPAIKAAAQEVLKGLTPGG
jgi:serine/threonine protein kinase